MDILSESLIDEEEAAAAAPEMPEMDYTEYAAPGLNIDLSWLRTETGCGSIENYLDHVLNINHSRGVAQILRGLTGIFDNLNLAILDITFGMFELVKEKRGVNAAQTFNRE